MKKNLIKKCAVSGMLVFGLAAAITAGYTASNAFAGEQQSEQILDNVYVGELAVGGMSGEEADEAVKAYVDGLQKTKFTLKADHKTVKATAAQLGVTWENTRVVEEAMAIGKSGSLISRYKDKKDLEHEAKVLELNFTADEAKVKSYLDSHVKKLNQDAVDSTLKRENGSFQIVDGENGVAVDVAESTENIIHYIENEWDAGQAEITLTADVVEPRGTREELSKVKDVLGQFSTDYSASSYGRAQNVSTGCNKINGTVLYPGDKFSVYETVSPFDAEHGYALAGSYENGRVVDTYGGGICQVSTTLYNAAILAELEITERSPHSMLVSYVEPSMDAAIAGTVKDLKFVNSTEAPIYIDGQLNGGIITFTIYGEETRDPNREVSFESEVLGEIAPQTQIQGSNAYPVGYVGVTQSSHVGKSAKLWKVVKVNGKEVSREEFNSSNYSASPRIVVVGTSTSSPEASSIIQNAIASQNESTIYTAAANAAAVAARPAAPATPEETEQAEEPESSSETTQEEPEAEQPAADEPAAEQPAVEEPAAEEPAAEQQAEVPAAEEPAAETPAGEE